MDSNQLLTTTLQKAAETLSYPDLEKFFHNFLEAVVFIPANLNSNPQKEVPIIGQPELNKTPYLMIHADELSTLPIFSEENFLISWAEREIHVVEQKVSTLLWQLPPNTILHLNPNQEIGKEFSPIEIEFLKNGKDAIPELVALAQEEEQQDLEIELPSDELLKLVPALLPVLQIYPELDEAFLLAIREVESSSARALIGLKYSKPLENEKINYIRSEIERTAQEFLLSPFTGVFIVDDLGNPHSPNQSLFLDFIPFYKNKNNVV